MIPSAFEYSRPASLDEAVKLLADYGEDAKLLAGGHSLIPSMKMRLAGPGILIDIGRISELRYIRNTVDGFAIGATTTHYEIESSTLLREGCPLMGMVARRIGDVQVRNKGTIGGSLAHADPAADWPAAMLALDATIEVAGSGGRRTIRAADFFIGLFETDLNSGEVICEIRVPSTGRSVAYVKTPQKASGFAVTGVAAVVESGSVRVGVTGVAPTPYRANAVEDALRGQMLTDDAIRAASDRAADGVDPLSDMHASSEYRAHLAKVDTERALKIAAGLA